MVLRVARSTSCTVPVNHDESAKRVFDSPTAKGYSSSGSRCMRKMSLTAPFFRSTSRKPKTSATQSLSPSAFMPAGTATAPPVRRRSSPVAGLKASTALLAMFDT